MQKNEIVATIIMEEFDERLVDKPKELKVMDKNGMFYVSFVSVLQEFEEFNRNRRKYRKAPMWESLNMPHLVELRAANSWCGEAGHPMSDETKRILTIDPKLISHHIPKIWLDGNLLYGEVFTLDDGGGYGTKMTRNILQGQEPAFSLRALAQVVKDSSGYGEVKTKAHIVCYDRVILPSHVKAYRDKTKPIKKNFVDIAVESFEGISDLGNGFESRIVSVCESQLVDFILESSDNVKIVTNLMQSCGESFTLTPDLKNVIIKEGSSKYMVKVEDKIRYDVMNTLSKL